MAGPKYTIHGDASSALREFKKLADENARLRRGLQETRRGARGAKREFRGAGDGLAKAKGAAMGLLGIFGIGGGLVGGLTKIVALVRQWEERQKGLVADFEQSASGMVAFLMQQPAGTGRARMEQALNLGVHYGQRDPGQILGTVQAFQASAGTFRGGMASAEAAFQLAGWAEVPLESAKGAVGVGVGLGLTPRESARAVVAAGLASELTPTEMAAMAPTGLPAWMGIKGGPVLGYGIAAALSKVIKDPGKLGTYTKQIGVALQTSTGELGEFWKAHGFATPGMRPLEQLRLLKQLGIDTMGELQAIGLAQKRSMGLAIALGGGPEEELSPTARRARAEGRDVFAANLRTVAQVRGFYAEEDLIARLRMQAEEEAPELTAGRARRSAQGRRAKARLMGPQAQRAQDFEAFRADLGAWYEEQDMGWYVDAEGRADWWGRANLRYWQLTGFENPEWTRPPPRRAEATEIKVPGLKVRVTVEDDRAVAGGPPGGE